MIYTPRTRARGLGIRTGDVSPLIGLLFLLDLCIKRLDWVIRMVRSERSDRGTTALQPTIGVRMGSGVAAVAGDAWAIGLLPGLDCYGPRRTAIRDSVWGTAGSRSRSRRHVGAPEPSRPSRPSRQPHSRGGGKRLMVYYAVVSIIYAILWVLLPSTAEALIVGFIALLLMPAIVSERRRWRR